MFGSKNGSFSRRRRGRRKSAACSAFERPLRCRRRAIQGRSQTFPEDLTGWGARFTDDIIQRRRFISWLNQAGHPANRWRSKGRDLSYRYQSKRKRRDRTSSCKRRCTDHCSDQLQSGRNSREQLLLYAYFSEHLKASFLFFAESKSQAFAEVKFAKFADAFWLRGN